MATQPWIKIMVGTVPSLRLFLNGQVVWSANLFVSTFEDRF